jgi:predicted heme/steroid binding protein
MHSSNKKRVVIVSMSATLVVIFTLWFFAGYWSRGTSGHQEVAKSALPTLSLNELAQYDGSSTTLPLYIGLDGYIYDVTAGKKFYIPGAVYHYLVGKDSSKSLNIMGGEIIKQKYPIVGIIEK